MKTSKVEKLYRKRMSELGGEGRIARVNSLFNAGREILAERLLAQNPHLSGRKLKREIARLMYRKDVCLVQLVVDCKARDD